MSRRPPGMPETATSRTVWFEITEMGFRGKFAKGSGLGIRRDNPVYYEVVGEWICNEMDALAKPTPKKKRGKVKP